MARTALAALSALAATAGGLTIVTASASSAQETVPLVTCATDNAIFNTGINDDADGAPSPPVSTTCS